MAQKLVMLTPPEEYEKKFQIPKEMTPAEELFTAFAELDDLDVGYCDMDTFKYVLRCFRAGLFDFEFTVVLQWITSYIKGNDIPYPVIAPILAGRLQDRLWGKGEHLIEQELKQNKNTPPQNGKRLRIDPKDYYDFDDEDGPLSV